MSLSPTPVVNHGSIFFSFFSFPCQMWALQDHSPEKSVVHSPFVLLKHLANRAYSIPQPSDVLDSILNKPYQVGPNS
jgi:hypothetical protein